MASSDQAQKEEAPVVADSDTTAASDRSEVIAIDPPIDHAPDKPADAMKQDEVVLANTKLLTSITATEEGLQSKLTTLVKSNKHAAEDLTFGMGELVSANNQEVRADELLHVWRNEVNPLPTSRSGYTRSDSVPGAHAVAGAPRNLRAEPIALEQTSQTPHTPQSLPATLVVSTQSRNDADSSNREQRTRIGRQEQPDIEEGNGVSPAQTMLVEARVMKDGEARPNNRFGWALLVVLVLIFVIILLILGLAGVFSSDEMAEPKEKEIPATGAVALSPVPSKVSRLEKIRQAGVLKCAFLKLPGPYLYRDEQTGQVSGFCSEWCTAVAAAIFGPENAADAIEYVPFNPYTNETEKWTQDMNAVGFTHTMERQVYESSIQQGLSFSTPFYYDGIRLGGLPFYVECADEKDFRHTEECSDLQLCVMDGSSHTSFARSKLPERRITLASRFGEVVELFVNGTCNVFFMQGVGASEAVVRSNYGYDGEEYAMGTSLYTKEPMALVSSAGDDRWSDFINAVFNSLLVAEQHKITRATAHLFPQTDLFGEEYQDAFRNAIAAVGNYGEIYERHMEPFLPRNLMNRISDAASTTTGLMYSHPMRFEQEEASDREILGPILEEILERGFVRCGVRSGRPGFATLNNTTNLHIGMDTDYCRAIASSLFGGNGNAAECIEVGNQTVGFEKLASGDIDVLAGATWNLMNDVREPTTGDGFAFSKPYFFGYSEEEDNLCLVTSQEDHDWASYVYWIVEGLVFAEEEGITKEQFNDMPLVPVFGDKLQRMFRDSVLVVGNYGEMYEHNLASLIPRSGRNLLNGNHHPGPQHYPMPGIYF